MKTTPVEKVDGIFVKRDDLFIVAGVSGGKARTCWALSQGAIGLVSAGSRHSPQVAIVAAIASALGIPSHAHVPLGKNTPVLEFAESKGMEIIRHKAGYNGVIICRARQDAEATGFTNIPFGMECEEAVKQTASQVANIPKEATRIVMPVGSGMSLAGVLTGLEELGVSIPVVGIVIGADPTRRLNRYAPLFWRIKVTLVRSNYKYHEYCRARIGDNDLDPVYEAKCVEYLQKGDLFWIVGNRKIDESENRK